MVTALSFAEPSLLNKRISSPESIRTPAAKESSSKAKSLAGTAFQDRTAEGKKIHRRCPASRTSAPQWKGCTPQKSAWPSKNCEDCEEKVNSLFL